jgi:hypothetical protein
LARCFTPALGFGEILRINVLDGVRVHFANGDVVHIRPSGNALQSVSMGTATRRSARIEF